jgi:PAS domain S-box-containing protein
MSQLAWIARADGFIFWYNRRWYEYTGTTPEQMEGWGWQSVHDPAVLPRVMEQWQQAINTGKSFGMEFPLRRADGEFGLFLTRGEPLRNAAGQVVQWFGTNTDVTELKHAEEEVHRLNAELEQRVLDRTAELEAANHELEAFSYSVSHDLRTPVRAIDGFSQAVLEDFGPQLPEEGRHDLQTIRQAAQRMGTLIDDLLAFARLSRQELNRRAVDTGRLVHATLEELGSPWADRQVKVMIGELPPCSGDPALLKQVWINLLSNALKYSRKREKTLIEIGCTKTAGVDTYFVRDNGIGFDMRYADKLFGVFQRFHRLEDFEGTGVGLATVQRIVHRHGGRIWAEAAVDHGATFYFTLEKETTP